jgi:NAD(P)-dependent dehydrogenase (short-subunit alcohol dehydrogenase family)
MTNIVQSVDMTKFDREASAALKPIQDAHIQGAAGLPLQPDEIAKTIVFLASENARYISGALVPVDLGWSTI